MKKNNNLKTTTSNEKKINAVKEIGKDDAKKSGNTKFLRMNNAKNEYYTPRVLVDVILPYVQKGKTVWCPFDTENSEFVRAFQQAGLKVIYSHIAYGQDFFAYEPDEEYDYIISNVPFSIKLDVFKRLFNLGKPFAMVNTVQSLNYQDMGKFFFECQQKGQPMQLLMVDKKISFDGNTCSFNSSFFCGHGFLPENILWVHLPHCNTGKNFVPSHMECDRKMIESKLCA